MFAIDDSASIFWARLIRGTMSMASTVMPLAFMRASSSSLAAGHTKETRVLPSGDASTSCIVGSRTLTTTSAALHSAAAESTTSTPAATYASSGIDAGSPAPASTTHS